MNKKDELGQTPIHVVRTYEVGQLLVAKRADVNQRDSSGRTPLHYAAARSNSAELIYLLLEAGADYNVASGSDENYSNEQHKAVHFAAAQCNPQALNALIVKAAGSSRIRTPVLHRVPLHFAVLSSVASSDPQKQLDTISVLLRHHRSDEKEMASFLEDFDVNSETALHMAVACENIPVCHLLIQAGASLESRDKFLQTPLHLAVASGNSNLVRLLAKSGANLTALNGNGLTPIHIAGNN